MRRQRLHKKSVLEDERSSYYCWRMASNALHRQIITEPEMYINKYNRFAGVIYLADDPIDM